jgi:copper(I)-binding protein
MKYFILLILFLFQSDGKITVKDPWMRPAPKSFNTAFYCTVINNGSKADTLYKAASNISDDVQIHETYKKGDLLGMRPVKDLIVAPQDSLVFKPGGYHIMLMNLNQEAVLNQRKMISLFFKTAGEVKVQASIGSSQ